MTEVTQESVSLVVISPPYNIGTHYGTNVDTTSFSEYKKLMLSVIQECARVLRTEGTLIIEAADTVSMNGRYVALAGLLQKIALGAGFTLFCRDINFVHTEQGIELQEDVRWSTDYVAEPNAHSNCHQWLAFSKKPRPFQKGTVSYVNYISTPEHPCPFPDQTIAYLLDNYFSGGIVLEPFMGTARLGKAVIVRGGQYIGYEIDKTIFGTAQKTLSRN